MATDLQTFVNQIRSCTLCRADMERAPNPILQVAGSARILVASQAPGNRADTSGIPFNDPSGDRLRHWMDVSRDEFYDAERVAIVPMGFCFPGYDRNGGDRPPMKRCATTWRAGLIDLLPEIRVRIFIGAYAQRWHLGPRIGKTLRDTILENKNLMSEHTFTTPHPSWRNTSWLKRNPWFEKDILPELRASVRWALSG